MQQVAFREVAAAYNVRAVAARMPNFIAFPTDRLLIGLNYSAPFIGNPEGVGDGWLGENHTDKVIAVLKAGKVMVGFVFQADHSAFNFAVWA